MMHTERQSPRNIYEPRFALHVINILRVHENFLALSFKSNARIIFNKHELRFLHFFKPVVHLLREIGFRIITVTTLYICLICQFKWFLIYIGFKLV